MARESIEALLNPSLKVSRPVAACARCRSAKIKCDGKLPACSGCERAGKAKDCSSANDDFARGKERSYVAALETAIQRLQKKVEDAKMGDHYSRRSSLMMLTHGRPPLQHKSMSNSQRKEASSVDELVSDFGFLTVNATSRDFHGFSSTMSFAKLLKAISVKQVLPVFDDESLPPRQSISHLVNYYFENIYVMLPFFSETEYMSSLSKVYADSQAQSLVSPCDLWSVRLVLAISSASLCQTRGDENYNAAIRHISAAMNLAEHVIYPGSIVGVQALLLLVQYSLVDPEYFDSWYLIGMAARLVVDLGLHCEPAPETKISKQALDLRRRIFYCTYAIDRVVSMSLGFAFSFTDDSAPNVLLPTLATDQESRSPSQLFLRSVRPSLFLFDIRRVQSAFYQKTRWSARQPWTMAVASEYVSSTVDDIQAWQRTFPPSFSQKHLQTFYLESLYSQALVLSPNQVIPNDIIPDLNKITFFHAAVEYSEQLRMMVQSIELQACLLYTDFCRARFVSRQFQNIMWANFDLLLRGSSIPGSPSSPNALLLENCNKAIVFLTNISQVLEWPKQRWGISALQEIFEQESAVLLERLKSRHQEYSMNQMPVATTAAPAPQPGFFSNMAGFQQMQPPPQTELPTTQSYSSNYMSYPTPPEDNPAMYSNSAMHRSMLLRATSWSPQAEQDSFNLPSGSLPRRSYNFTGGQG
ncbi:hypothetical protein H2198_003393 [Neophaeococcomyces mojaviensis]|uniref:Uncharacterized protein n=1 Tax=Neophaeococcomyces mojaviensis TaxID=3383035 RepID=A0ACC3ABE8_9EURO|nr:hypothetical protein H2198_003393 [Knufia sp. JES_112]